MSGAGKWAEGNSVVGHVVVAVHAVIVFQFWLETSAMLCPDPGVLDDWGVSVPGQVAALLSGWGPDMQKKT